MREIGFSADGGLGLTIIGKIVKGMQNVGSEALGNVAWETMIGHVTKDNNFFSSFKDPKHCLKALGFATGIGSVFYVMGEAVKKIGYKAYEPKESNMDFIKKLLNKNPISTTLATGIAMISAYQSLKLKQKDEKNDR